MHTDEKRPGDRRPGPFLILLNSSVVTLFLAWVLIDHMARTRYGQTIANVVSWYSMAMFGMWFGLEWIKRAVLRKLDSDNECDECD